MNFFDASTSLLITKTTVTKRNPVTNEEIKTEKYSTSPLGAVVFSSFCIAAVVSTGFYVGNLYLSSQVPTENSYSSVVASPSPEPTATPTPTDQSDPFYVMAIACSNRRFTTSELLEWFGEKDLSLKVQLLINYLYALKGLKFDAEHEEYFGAFEWYLSIPEKDAESCLASFSDIEQTNLDLLTNLRRTLNTP